MGTPAVRDLVELQQRPLEQCAGWRVAVDAHNWLYRYRSPVVRYRDPAVYTTDDGREVPHLLGALTGVGTLLEQFDPVFVFDGSPVDLKAAEVAARRERREVAERRLQEARETGDPEAIRKYKAQTQRLDEQTLSTTRELLDLLDLPWVQAPAAGEAQAAHMVRQGVCDAVVSDDYDAVLFGSPATLRQCSGEGPAEYVDLSRSLAELGIDRRQLVDVAMLCGTDYNDGVDGVGPTYGLRGVREHGSAEAYLGQREGSLPAAEAVRRHYLDPPVTDVDDLNGREAAGSVDPNLAAARSYLVEEWDLPEGEVDDGLGRVSAALR